MNAMTRRWLARASFAPVVILVAFARASLLWVAVVAVALMLLAAGTARTAQAMPGFGCGGAFGAEVIPVG